ncbi:MAG: VOC family protein [Chromatiales bacterium]|nr:MAG: VOC family protein [Chromatiales bacterium]
MTDDPDRGGPPLNIQALDHVVLRCSDLEATLAFYGDVLGCVVERILEEEGLYQLRAGASLIDLVPVGSPLGGSNPPESDQFNVAHICLRIDPPDWEQLTAYLKQRGIPAGDIRTRYGADGFGASIYVRDPEGNQVELKAGVIDDNDA